MTENASILPAPADNTIVPGKMEEAVPSSSGTKVFCTVNEDGYIFEDSIPGKLFISDILY